MVRTLTVWDVLAESGMQEARLLWWLERELKQDSATCPPRPSIPGPLGQAGYPRARLVSPWEGLAGHHSTSPRQVSV